jgi:hypothetical protein
VRGQCRRPPERMDFATRGGPASSVELAALASLGPAEDSRPTGELASRALAARLKVPAGRSMSWDGKLHHRLRVAVAELFHPEGRLRASLAISARAPFGARSGTDLSGKAPSVVRSSSRSSVGAVRLRPTTFSRSTAAGVETLFGCRARRAIEHHAVKPSVLSGLKRRQSVKR